VANADCGEWAGGAAAICRKSTHTCARLVSPDCKVLAEPSTIADDRTVWFGSMFPATGPDAALLGAPNTNALELARRDFMTIGHGLPSTHGGPPRPIGIVACDDDADPRRAANHLVTEIGVPAIIGFHRSAVVLDLATSVFLPNGTLVLSSMNRSPMLSTVPQRAGQPRLLWRTTFTTEHITDPLSAVLESVVAPALRHRSLPKGRDRNLRVAAIRAEGLIGITFSDAVLSKLHLHGKPVFENAESFRTFLDQSGKESDLVRELAEFRPHAILYLGEIGRGLAGRVFEPLEAAWPTDADSRPYYVGGSTFFNDELAFIGHDADRRRRVFGQSAAQTTENAKFVMRYNEVFEPKQTVTGAPNSTYDAFYALAYATLASGTESPSGADIGKGMSRLVPPGVPIGVGPTRIYDAFNTLNNGGSIDLAGAASSLDFDMATGDVPTRQAILCASVDATGRAVDTMESGLVYDPTEKKMVGTLKCP
jgi:branched-chain amino acid transport system substrate-binding protein